ncbi:hypothetical protein SUDANB146_00235 [Streptomyces sp. enrichment culture]
MAARPLPVPRERPGRGRGMGDRGRRGRHGAAGSSLADGRHDRYRNENAVPPAEAFRLVEHVVRTGDRPLDARRAVDR